MSDSGKLILKFMIVFVIFPTIAYLAAILSGFVLIWPVALLPKSSQETGFAVLEVVTTAISLLGGFLFSWRIWPRETIETTHGPSEPGVEK